MRVPDDVAIMGYDNIKLSKYLELTTIDQKMYTIGVQATKRLAEIIEKPDDEIVNKFYQKPLHFLLQVV